MGGGTEIGSRLAHKFLSIARVTLESMSILHSNTILTKNHFSFSYISLLEIQVF